MTFALTAKWTAKEGEEDAVAAAIANLIEPSRAEPGNLFYQCHRDPENPRVFFFYEQYADADAFAAHGQTEHFAKWAAGDAFPRLESRERAFYETWDG